MTICMALCHNIYYFEHPRTTKKMLGSPDQGRAVKALRQLANTTGVNVHLLDNRSCLNAADECISKSQTHMIVVTGVAARFVVCLLFRQYPNIMSNANPFGKPPPDSRSLAILWNGYLWWGDCEVIQGDCIGVQALTID